MNIKMINIPTIDVIDVSRIKGIRDLYDGLCKLNFCTPDNYWVTQSSIESLFLLEPMFVRKVGSEFELIAGFRTFFISLIVRPSSVHAYDISDWTEAQQVLLALESTTCSLLLWATKNTHAEANIFGFLKIVDQLAKDYGLNVIDQRSFKQKLNRHQGRKVKLTQSSLQKTIETHRSKGK